MEHWKNTGIKSEVVEEIRQLAEKYQVKRTLLFGSRARGDFRRESDIDLAVEGGDVTAFALDADETTSTLLRFDIVDLEDISPGEFLKMIRKEGVILYEEV